MFEHFASCEANNFVPYLKPYKKHFFYLRNIYLKKTKRLFSAEQKFDQIGGKVIFVKL